MDYRMPAYPAVPSQDEINRTFTSAMGRVYLWMTGGLILTAVVAMYIAANPALQERVFGNGWTIIGLIAAQLGLVYLISTAIDKLAPAAALGLFFLYSALVGFTLSIIFVYYSLGSIGLAFVATASVFTGLSIVGLTTKMDLTKWGPMLMAALLGLIVASIANWFLQSTFLEWAVSFGGVIIFMGLTVYDSKKIKEMTSEALVQGDTLVVQRIGILGALNLYLDFLNMFLFILRIVGNED